MTCGRLPFFHTLYSAFSWKYRLYDVRVLSSLVIFLVDYYLGRVKAKAEWRGEAASARTAC